MIFLLKNDVFSYLKIKKKSYKKCLKYFYGVHKRKKHAILYIFLQKFYGVHDRKNGINSSKNIVRNTVLFNN